MYNILNINNRKLSRAKSVRNKKLSNLVFENSNFISETTRDPEKVIFNFSGYERSDDENRCSVKV